MTRVGGDVCLELHLASTRICGVLFLRSCDVYNLHIASSRIGFTLSLCHCLQVVKRKKFLCSGSDERRSKSLLCKFSAAGLPNHLRQCNVRNHAVSARQFLKPEICPTRGKFP